MRLADEDERGHREGRAAPRVRRRLVFKAKALAGTKGTDMSRSMFEHDSIGGGVPAQDSRSKPADMARELHTWRPEAEGLYDPAQEKDSCGVGFIANIKGQKSHQI